MPVIDASIVVDWVAPNADPHSTARELLDRLADQSAELRAPRLLREEVGNALLTGVRRGRWNGSAADESFGLLRALPVQIVDGAADLDRAWDLSRRFDEHPLYDMVYVALAERLGDHFFTADRTLARRLSRLGFVSGVE